LKIPNVKKRAGGVAQDVDPEFKFQCCKKRKKPPKKKLENGKSSHVHGLGK
jgi:hypothetical protein